VVRKALEYAAVADVMMRDSLVGPPGPASAVIAGTVHPNLTMFPVEDRDGTLVGVDEAAPAGSPRRASTRSPTSRGRSWRSGSVCQVVRLLERHRTMTGSPPLDADHRSAL
jgi:hypothetical protein